MVKNSVMMQAFEWYLPSDGSHYKDLKEKAEDLKNSGIDSVWLPPVYKGMGQSDAGYAIYDLFDLGEFDQKGGVRTKYGTLDELRELIEELHNNDIRVYADVVLNHKAAADFTEEFEVIEVDQNDRSKEISEPHTIEGWTGFNFPGREGKYSDFEWNHNHFSGIDYDQKEDRNGVFKITGEGKYWSDGVSNEKGNYDYLMFADIDHKHPEVQEELFYWGEWFADFVAIDGMRLDALKHIDDDFIEEFIKHLEDNVEQDLYFFGEYWMYDTDEKNKYLYETKYHTDLFDVALHYNMEQASKDNKNYDLRTIFDNTLVEEHPTIAVTFVDNHDSQPGQSLESFVEPWFKKIAYSLILLRKDGYPCVFYGDYYGVEGENAVEGQKEMIDQLIDIRKRYAYGEQTNYPEGKDLIGWVRHGDEEHPGSLAVLISTGDAQMMRMQVGEENAGKIFVELTGDNPKEIEIEEDGSAEFEVGPGTMTAWAEKLND
jgi:alpha-amylase